LCRELDSFRCILERTATGNSAQLPLLVYDSILPLQTLSFRYDSEKHYWISEMIGDLLRKEALGVEIETGIGMVGQSDTGQGFAFGTEVVVVDQTIDGTEVEVQLQGRRAFRLSEKSEPHFRGDYPIVEVEWIGGGGGTGEEQEIQSDSASLEGLVADWQELVRSGGHEREPNQLELIQRDLGPIPPATNPDARAMWVAALINPLPALGVALEIRPSILSASTTAERVLIAKKGITSSINHLNGTRPMW
jgi:hypothetical protein